MLANILVFILGNDLIIADPRVRLVAHQAAHVVTLDQYHDVAIRLFFFHEAPLFDHLCVVYEADEFPLSQVDHSLLHVVHHIHYCYLFVSR